MRSITHIVIHCTATPEGREHTAAEIRSWHLAKGWKDIGYHYVVKLDGSVESGRPVSEQGAHVKGHNATTIGVVYVGGMDKGMKEPKDTRTEAQKDTLRVLLTELKKDYPHAQILGHNDFPGVAKACPSFDALTEYAQL